MRPSLFLLSAAILFSNTSYASRARLQSLQGANHVIDEQMVFLYPARIHKAAPLLSLEMGATGSDAEGGIFREMSNKDRLFVYLGRDMPRQDMRGTEFRNGFIQQQNPIDITYGSGSWAVGATLSMIDNKKSKTKEQTVGLRFGMNLDGAEFFASADAVSTAEKANGANTDKVVAAPYIAVGGTKDFGDYHVYGQIQFGDGKTEIATVSTKVKDMNVALGFEDRSLKSAGSDLYYGAQIIQGTREYEGKKVTGMRLPIYIGIEHDLNSWAVLRGSISQNLLVGDLKDETATSTDADGIASNTNVAAGVGLTHNKVRLDGTLEASTSGLVNGSAVLARAALLYFF